MQFTPEQARVLAGVSRETLRHWKKAVPYLCAKSGKAARFTLVDVIGLAVTQELVEKLGLQIASVGKGVDVMFSLFAQASPESLDLCNVVISTARASLQEVSCDLRLKSNEPIVVVPLAPIVSAIQQNMFPIAARMRQHDLRFPPEPVRRMA